MQVSFLYGASARRCRKNLPFDCKRFEIWLVNTGHVKTKRVGKLDSFGHICSYSGAKAEKCSSCYLFWLGVGVGVGVGGLFSRNRLLYYFELLFYSYLQRFFKIGVFKTLCTIRRKTTVSEDSDIDAFLWILRNCQEHLFYKNTWFCIFGTYM